MERAAQSWLDAPRPPQVRLPSGATDAHCHVFGPEARFAFDPASPYRPTDAPKEALFALHHRAGLDRRVIVQAGCHGFDNAAVADAIAARPETSRGIALAPADVPEQHLRRLAAQGFCGLRFNFMAHLASCTSPEALVSLAPRLADRGMHLQIHTEAAFIADLAPVLAALPVPVVIDHMGRIDASQGAAPAGLDALLRLLKHDHVWIKVSALERASRRDAPWEDALPLAHRLLDAAPDRALWGTDWPHPNFRASPPDDGTIIDLLPRIAPSPDRLQSLLVNNPARLFGFGAS